MINKKKRHFESMLNDATRVLWETEFQKFTVLQLRETIRRQYDQSQQALEAIEARVKGTDDKSAKDDKLAIEKQADGLKDQLDAIDTRLNGGPPCALIPDGVSTGLNEDLQNKADRLETIRQFIKYNC